MNEKEKAYKVYFKLQERVAKLKEERSFYRKKDYKIETLEVQAEINATERFQKMIKEEFNLVFGL